jgi:hypothetical protein
MALRDAQQTGTTVDYRHLSVYLNDHLAGSSDALEILAELQRLHGVEVWTSRVRSDIAEDREELEKLMRRVGIARVPSRAAASWIAERTAGAKARAGDPLNEFFYRFELIEALALGLDAKRALWTALQTTADEVLALQHVDYDRLIARADDQRRRVEIQRLQAAADALSRRI